MSEHYSIQLPTARAYTTVLGFLADQKVKLYSKTPSLFLCSTEKLSEEQEQYIKDQGGRAALELRSAPESPSVIAEAITLYALQYLISNLAEEEEYLQDADFEGIHPNLLQDIDLYATICDIAYEKARGLGIDLSNFYL